jgi:capsular exopolysaccharide synthesis family protein
MADYTSGESNPAPKNGLPSNGNAGRAAANGINGTNGANGTYGHPAPLNPMPGHPGPTASPTAVPDTGVDGLLHIVRRQWHVVTLCTIAVLLISILYLLVTKPVYTSTALLRVKPLDAASIASGTSESPQEQDADFLDTECVVIKSDAVLALAMDKIRDTRTLKGISHPMDYVRTHLTADLAKKGQEIEVSFDSKFPDDANLIVNSVVQAYKDYESQSWKSRADEVLDTLKAGSKGAEQQLVDTELKMRDIEQKNGFVPDTDPSKNPQHQEVLSLIDAKDKAHLELMEARNAYEQATRGIFGDPVKLKAVAEAEQKARFSSDPKALLQKYQDALAVEQAKLVDDGRQYMPNHPTIIADQARVDELVVLTVVAAKEWEESAQAQYEADDKSLTEAQKAEVASADSQREYMQLQLEADHLKKGADDVDNRIAQIDLTKGAGALNISVLNSAGISGDPKPTKPKTLGIGLVLGVILGVGMACVRDWTDDRMRTPQSIRASAGAPVLGSIPNITTAYTAADRGQIVHHDPFGDAAESYRTIRTALQFGLPAGTKTLLVTSPVSGDGKSTFVSNLGIAMAQASRRVLIIDADLRAPMQHRLFGLKDRMGLATVLAGGDTMAQAIQRTEIEGLDLLPCGPTPTNPAELLNSEAFTDQLNELADKYDLVILDSPPVTAVADARILAASADSSILIVRLDASTRKQTEAARDGLRSVGARLIGVAVNGVARGGAFGGASGYYPHGDLATPIIRASKRPAFTNPQAEPGPPSRA